MFGISECRERFPIVYVRQIGRYERAKYNNNSTWRILSIVLSWLEDVHGTFSQTGTSIEQRKDYSKVHLQKLKQEPFYVERTAVQVCRSW